MAKDSNAKSAAIGRIGAFIAALSMTQLQGLVTATCTFINAHGGHISIEVQDAWVGILTQIFPIYIMFATGRSKLNEEQK
jgi:hypothetical protein